MNIEELIDKLNEIREDEGLIPSIVVFDGNGIAHEIQWVSYDDDEGRVILLRNPPMHVLERGE